MIKYKCVSCGAQLETDDSLSGKKEACPACGTVNPIPYSKHDLAEARRIKKEKVRQQQEEEKRKKQQQRQAADLEKQRRTAATQARPAAPAQGAKPSPVGPSVTESVLQVIGFMIFGLGVTIAVISVVVAIRESEPTPLVAGVAAIVVSFLWAMPFFIMQLVLRYLRRIMNAVEWVT